MKTTQGVKSGTFPEFVSVLAVCSDILDDITAMTERGHKAGALTVLCDPWVRDCMWAARFARGSVEEQGINDPIIIAGVVVVACDVSPATFVVTVRVKG